jgi:hypothetical protein
MRNVPIAVTDEAIKAPATMATKMSPVVRVIKRASNRGNATPTKASSINPGLTGKALPSRRAACRFFASAARPAAAQMEGRKRSTVSRRAATKRVAARAVKTSRVLKKPPRGDRRLIALGVG